MWCHDLRFYTSLERYKWQCTARQVPGRVLYYIPVHAPQCIRMQRISRTISWGAYNPIQKRFLAIRTIRDFVVLTAYLTCQALQSLANVIGFMYNQFSFLVYFLKDSCSIS